MPARASPRRLLSGRAAQRRRFWPERRSVRAGDALKEPREAGVEVFPAQLGQPFTARSALADDSRLAEHAEVMRRGGFRNRQAETATGPPPAGLRKEVAHDQQP